MEANKKKYGDLHELVVGRLEAMLSVLHGLSRYANDTVKTYMRTHDASVAEGPLIPAQLVEKSNFLTDLTATVATFNSPFYKPSNVTAGPKPDADRIIGHEV